MRAELKVVFNEDGTHFYDIFIEGRWVGSRRTIAQCYEQMQGAGVTAVKLPDWGTMARRPEKSA